MKKFCYFLVIALVSAITLSCEKSQKDIEVEFSRALYSLYNGGSVDVTVKLSEPTPADISIDLKLGGTAVEGTNYEISSKTVEIPAGEDEATVSIKALEVTGEEEIAVTFSLPTGYTMGSKFTTIISTNVAEAIIYSFKYETATVLESYKATIELTRSSDNEPYIQEEDLVIPVSLSGAGASMASVVNDSITVKAGESIGVAEITIDDPAFSGKEEMTLSLKSEAQTDLFTAGEISEMNITVRGLLTPKSLEGTWVFSEVINLASVEEWFGYYDDIDKLPTHNEGFKLRFTVNADGTGKVTPLGTGDWNNFFRESNFVYTEPINMTPDGYKLGLYSSEELNMFIGEITETPYQTTYFELANANRKFDAEKEDLNKAAIAMFLDVDDNLIIEFRDYDTPLFGETWWRYFDSDMFGFASKFVKE